MPKYKDQHGTTRVGDFLRSIGKSDIVQSIVGNLPEKGVLGVFKAFLDKDGSLPPQDKETALKLLEMDLNEMQGVTDRWQSDMTSDSWFSKNTRPLTLIFLTVMMTLFVILDSSKVDFTVKNEFIDLLKYLFPPYLILEFVIFDFIPFFLILITMIFGIKIKQRIFVQIIKTIDDDTMNCALRFSVSRNAIGRPIIAT